MAATARDIARELGLSPAAVSMALNNRPGVSAATRKLVYDTAEKLGYDLSRHLTQPRDTGSIYFICVQTSSAIFSYAPIFDEILRGAVQECQAHSYRIKVQQFYAQQDALEQQLGDLRVSDCVGVILLGTEMNQDVAMAFLSLRVPVIVVDSNVEPLDCSCVVINNAQGAYLATDYLISRRLTQPGYLKSFVPLRNFNERWEGFQKALRANGMHTAHSVVHTLAPTIEGAMTEMLEILDRHDPLANCYFAENDLIAIGAMKAFKMRGYRIPEDIAIVGFDNISEGRVMEPALTTINIPRTFMGRVAVRCLVDAIQDGVPHHIKVEVSTELVIRSSVVRSQHTP